MESFSSQPPDLGLVSPLFTLVFLCAFHCDSASPPLGWTPVLSLSLPPPHPQPPCQLWSMSFTLLMLHYPLLFSTPCVCLQNFICFSHQTSLLSNKLSFCFLLLLLLCQATAALRLVTVVSELLTPHSPPVMENTVFPTTERGSQLFVPGRTCQLRKLLEIIVLLFDASVEISGCDCKGRQMSGGLWRGLHRSLPQTEIFLGSILVVG